MRARRIVAILVVVAVIAIVALFALRRRAARSTGSGTPKRLVRAPVPPPFPSVAVFHSTGCDASLWSHVYHGRFPTAHDRLKILDDCTTVTGTIISDVSEADGDDHIRLEVDPKYRSLLNAKNDSEQHGYLVLEPVCEHRVKQKDTLEEGVCNGYHEHLFRASMKGKHATVTGSYVEDEEHGWREIHPVSSLQTDH